MRGWLRQYVVGSCTPESIEEKKISLLAVAEVVFAVGVYWSIAVYFNTHLHLIVSVIAAPLLLLRSDESCATAKKWMGDEGFLGDLDKEPARKIEQLLSPKKSVFWLIVLIAGAISSAPVWWMALTWLPDYEGFSLFWRAAVIGMITYHIAVAVAVAGAVAVTVTVAVAAAVSGAGAGAVAGAAAAAVAAAGAVTGAVAGAAAGVVAAAAAAAGAVAVAGAVSGAGAVARVAIAPGFAMGFFLLALTIRLLSTVKNFASGIRQWSTNWHRAMLCEDIRLEPALIPGIGSRGFTVSDAIGEMEIEWSMDSLVSTFIVSLFIALIWIPAQLWRWSIKATCWFYAPLYLLLSIGSETDPRKQKHALAASPGLIEWMGMLYAATVLLVAAGSMIDWSALVAQWRSIGGAAPAFNPLAWWFVTDCSKLIERPWQWFHLTAATLTLVCFLWLDQVHRMRKAAEKLGDSPDLDYPLDKHPGRTIYWMQRIKQWCVTAAMFTGMWYFAKWAYQAGKLPEWIKPVLGTFFGA